MNTVYFDNAATTPVNSEVIDVMTDCLKTIYGNPSSSHSYGRDAKAILEESRRKIANILGAKPSEIFFTSCGTESNNSILRNALQNDDIKRIISTPIEHPSIYSTLNSISNEIKIEYVKLDKYGVVNLEDLENLLSSDSSKALVSIMHANNEVGGLNDIKSIGDLCDKYQALFHSDMVQTMGHLPINLKEIKIDFLAASAHKFHGPKGVGFMFVRQPHKLNAFITGGSQERGMRSGTENMASIVGMAHALEIACSKIEEDIVHLNKLRHAMAEKLKMVFPNIGFMTNLDNSLCTILSVIFPKEFSNDMLLFQLDMKGVACSGGSACSSGANKVSHVLSHLNAPSDRKVVRFSFSKYNNLDEINFCVDKIKELASETSS